MLYGHRKGMDTEMDMDLNMWIDMDTDINTVMDMDIDTEMNMDILLQVVSFISK
jgi:hypothetical protein